MANLFLVGSPSAKAPPSAGPADASARLQSLDPRRSFLIEAPAGSGKTALLIQRFLTLLAQPDITSPDQVLAITFTRDATAELRERVSRQLELAAAGSEPQDSFDRLARPLAEAVLRRDRDLGWQLIDYPRRLNIKTIDAVCADIARSLPVLSGAGGSLAPTDEPAALYREAARRTLLHLGGTDQRLAGALETILLHRDADLGDTESLIANMLSLRDQWAGLVPLAPAALTDEALDHDVLPRLQQALKRAVCRGLTQLTRALPPPILEALCHFAAEMGHADGYDGNPSPIALCAGRYDVPGEQADHLDHWRALIHLLLTGTGEFRKGRGIHRATLRFALEAPHRARLAEIIDQIRDNKRIHEALLGVRALPPADYPAEQWLITRALFRVLSRALAELQVVFADRSACDFTEFSLLARAALKKDQAGDDLAQFSGSRLQHLLVDEMQDTSTGQYELIQLLTQNWDGYSQTVFLVGDPKQSIYLFREARVERFIHTMHAESLGDVPLTVLHLTANFRSQANLIDAFNEDFAAVFPPVPPGGLPADPERIAYLAATATRPRGDEPARHWHAVLAPDKPACATETLHHALEIRRQIERFRSRPLPPGRTRPWSIAVLVRGRAHLAPIVAALQQQPGAIPYRAVKIEPLGERQEILDLLALTRALLQPADRTAWLALLRSPLCGLSLDALHRIGGSDDHALMSAAILRLLSSRGNLLAPADRQSLDRFRAIMTEALRQRGTMRLSSWVHRTWLSFGAEPFTTPDQRNNIERFLELLDAIADSSDQPDDQLDLSLLTARLEKLYSNPSSEPDAVDLMTIHNAKGLEWDLVLVPSLERRAGADKARLLSWLELDGDPEEPDDVAAHGLLAPIQARGADSAILNTWMRSIQSARERAEVARLFYVACTRAREELHLFSVTTAKKDGELSAPTGTLLCAALPAAAQYFQPLEPPPLVMFPVHDPPAAWPGTLDRLAATSATPRLQRLPLSASASFTLPSEPPPAAPFLRPSGSYQVRTFGNAVHTFLEQLARELRTGTSCSVLESALPAREPAIHAVLRASGIAPAECDRLTPRVLEILRKTLADPVGGWILSPHPEASTEQTVHLSGLTLRPDRTFLAGSDPLSSGTTHLWIVDYKTAIPGGREIGLFLDEERAKYAPQLNQYIQALEGERPVRAALYYPAIPALVQTMEPAASS